MPELKPCPMCGGEAFLEVGRGASDDSIGCRKCGCWVSDFDHGEGQAITAWNTRAPDHGMAKAANRISDLSRQVGEMEGELETCQAVGIVDDWREKCEGLEARLAVAVEALEAIGESSAATEFPPLNRLLEIAGTACNALAQIKGGE